MTPTWSDRFLAAYRRLGWRGFRSLHRLLKKGSREEIHVFTKFGSQFLLCPWDVIDSHVLREGFYESEVIEAISPCLKAGSVVWFAGANFGLHAVTAKFLNPESTVVAFEPNPEMSRRILENAALNAVELTVLPLALGDSPGHAVLHINTSGNPGMSTLHPTDGFQYDTHLDVPLTTAAGVIASNVAQFPNALLMDVEGSEYFVLRGFQESLADPRLQRIVFEAANDLDTTDLNDPVVHLLRDAGFSKFDKLDRQESTSHNLSNYLALR